MLQNGWHGMAGIATLLPPQMVEKIIATKRQNARNKAPKLTSKQSENQREKPPPSPKKPPEKHKPNPS